MGDKAFFLLVAEDDEDDRELLQLVLKEDFPTWQYAILNNGKALLEYLGNYSNNSLNISLILMDINMPIKNGIKTLEELRSNPKYENMPIVGFSTAGNKWIINEFLIAGGTAFFQKPDSLDEIRNMLFKLPKIANF